MNESPAEAGPERSWPPNRAEWLVALSRMEATLHLLDESEAPSHIGAHLDLAIQQLKDEIDRSEQK